MSTIFSRQALFRFGPAAFMVVVIPALTLAPAYVFRGVESSLPPIGGIDKVVHALMYLALTAAALHTVPLSRRAHVGTVFVAALAVSLYGAFMELCQKWLTTTRCMDPCDALANAVGAFACALALWLWARHRLNAINDACPASAKRD